MRMEVSSANARFFLFLIAFSTHGCLLDRYKNSQYYHRPRVDDNDSENRRLSLSYSPVRGPLDLSSSFPALFLHCLLYSRKPPTFFRSVLTFSHPLRRAVCLIRRGGRRVETWGCGVGCEEHTGVRWDVLHCPVWLRNNHWSSRPDS